jgi:hypothetical protein
LNFTITEFGSNSARDVSCRENPGRPTPAATPDDPVNATTDPATSTAGNPHRTK